MRASKTKVILLIQKIFIYKMGTYNKGILGAFSGKVGPVVGATWRGKEVMRSLPKKSNRVATATQELQRLKFTKVTEFLRPLSPVLKRYYGNDTGTKTRRNQAMSYHMKNALNYVDPDFMWDYQKVQISRGDLTGFDDVAATPGTGQSIDINWTNNSGQGEALNSDKLVLVIYEETTNTSLYSLNSGIRGDETANYSVPAFLSGLPVQVWATFVAADDKTFATSLYLGEVLIA